MKTDAKGFLISNEAPRVSRTFVGVRAPELKALERSGNPSLLALAKRVREAIAKQDAYWKEKFERQVKLEAFTKTRQAEIDADPKLKAEQEARRARFADLLGGKS